MSSLPSPATAPSSATPPTQRSNPLHGLTLEVILKALVAHFGWVELGERIPVRCFTSDPSVASSLKFLRKTPWARDKLESLYLFMLRDIRRAKASDALDEADAQMHAAGDGGDAGAARTR